MTNREKFKEIFGFTPSEDANCPMPYKVCLTNDDICNNCPFDDWWHKEYMECFEIREEFEK